MNMRFHIWYPQLHNASFCTPECSPYKNAPHHRFINVVRQSHFLYKFSINSRLPAKIQTTESVNSTIELPGLCQLSIPNQFRIHYYKYGKKCFEAKHNFFLGGAAQAGAGWQGSENGGWPGIFHWRLTSAFTLWWAWLITFIFSSLVKLFSVWGKLSFTYECVGGG